VADAAVIPSPDEEPGKCPRRAWCLRALVSVAQLQAFVAARVAPYKKVRRLEVVDLDQSPKPPSGKLLRRVLIERERVLAASAGHQWWWGPPEAPRPSATTDSTWHRGPHEGRASPCTLAIRHSEVGAGSTDAPRTPNAPSG